MRFTVTSKYSVFVIVTHVIIDREMNVILTKF